MAAGRGFLHINAQGGVEPCPFAHVAADSIRSVSLRKALESPFLRSIRENQNWLSKPLVGCALYEHRDELLALAETKGAHVTDNIDGQY